MAVTHIAFDLRLGNQGRDRIDDDDVKGTRPDEHVRDLQRLLAVVRLRDDQGIGVDTQMPGIDRIQRVLGIDECRHPAVLLCVGDHM